MNIAYMRHAFVFVICAIQTYIILYRTSGISLFADDFLNYMQYEEHGFTVAYFLTGVFGQLVPGYRLAQGLVFNAFGVSIAGPLAIIVILSIASTLLVISIATRLDVPFPLIAAVAIVTVFLLQPTHVQLWWSTALHTLPSLVASLAAIWFLVGPNGRGPSRHGALYAAVCFAIGLSFFAKALFAAVIMFGVVLFIRWRDGPPVFPLAWTVLKDLRYVLGVAVIYVVVVIPRLVSSPSGKPPLIDLLKYIWLSWSDGTVATTLGLGTYGVRLISYELTVAIGLIVVAAIAAASVVLNGRRAVVLWAVLAIYVCGAMATIANARAVMFGLGSALSLRYNVENAIFLLLTTLISFSGAPMRPWPPLRTAAPIVVGVVIAINLQIQSRNVPGIGTHLRFIGICKHSRRRWRRSPARPAL